jgi:hypothetical protein
MFCPPSSISIKLFTIMQVITFYIHNSIAGIGSSRVNLQPDPLDAYPEAASRQDFAKTVVRFPRSVLEPEMVNHAPVEPRVGELAPEQTPHHFRRHRVGHRKFHVAHDVTAQIPSLSRTSRLRYCTTGAWALGRSDRVHTDAEVSAWRNILGFHPKKDLAETPSFKVKYRDMV